MSALQRRPYYRGVCKERLDCILSSYLWNKESIEINELFVTGKTSDIKHGNQTSNIRHQISDIGHGTSNVRRWTSDFKHQASDIGHKTWVIRHRRSKRNSKLHKECTCSVTFLPPSNFVNFDGLQGDENCTKLSSKPTLSTFRTNLMHCHPPIKRLTSLCVKSIKYYYCCFLIFCPLPFT